MPPLYILCGSRSALQPDGVVHHHGPGIGQLQVVAQLRAAAAGGCGPPARRTAGTSLIPALHVLIGDLDVLRRAISVVASSYRADSGRSPGIGTASPSSVMPAICKWSDRDAPWLMKRLSSSCKSPVSWLSHHGVRAPVPPCRPAPGAPGRRQRRPGPGPPLALEGCRHNGLAQDAASAKPWVRANASLISGAGGRRCNGPSPGIPRAFPASSGCTAGEGHGSPLLLRADAPAPAPRTVDEHAAAQQQGIILRLAALKGHAVHGAVKVRVTSSPMAARSRSCSTRWAWSHSSMALSTSSLDSSAWGMGADRPYTGQLHLQFGSARAVKVKPSARCPQYAALRGPATRISSRPKASTRARGNGVHRLLIEHVRGIRLLRAAGGLARAQPSTGYRSRLA